MTHQRSIIKYFLRLFTHPSNTIQQILQESPSFFRIVIFLCGVGILRGILEEVLQLLVVGQFSQVVSSPLLSKKYLLAGIPFLLSSVSFAYLRWVAFAFIVYFLGRFVGGKERFEHFLRIYGVILGIYTVAILPNFVYLIIKSPIITFRISTTYNPSFGIGQILTSCWLVFISYKVVRIIYKLPTLEAVFIGLSVPLINIGTLVFGALLYFKFSPLFSLSQRKVFSLATHALVIVPLLMIPFLLWLGYRIDRGRRAKKE